MARFHSGLFLRRFLGRWGACGLCRHLGLSLLLFGAYGLDLARQASRLLACLHRLLVCIRNLLVFARNGLAGVGKAGF